MTRPERLAAGSSPPALGLVGGDAPDGDDVLEVLSRGVLVLDANGVVVRANPAVGDLIAAPAAAVVGRPFAELLAAPDDRCAAEVAAVRTGERWSTDLLLAGPGGAPVLVHARAHPHHGPGRAVAAVVEIEDVREQRSLERRMADLAGHFDLALEAAGLGTWRWDMASGATLWDDRLEALYGLAPGTFGGTYEDWLAGQHPEDRDRVVATVEEAVRSRRGYVVEHRVVWPDGTVRWIQGRGQVLVDDDGEVTGTIGCVMDVTDQVVAAEELEHRIAEANEAAERERVHRERLEFLGRVNEALRLAVDRGDLMRRVTAAAVPRLGDWCALFLVADDGGPPAVEVAHVDPAMVALARELQERFPFDPDAPTGVPAVIRTGETQFVPEITDELIDDIEMPDEARPVLRRLALRSAIVVPLRKGERVLGAMQFVTSRGSRAYDADDVALAEAVGVRIASSLEVRRLSDQHREIARTLQRSLLPSSLPVIPGVDVAVRYWAAGESAEVGGDFYDVFALEAGRWGLAIGDVCGKGPAAAAVTALARHTIRSAAWHGDDPAAVLGSLNHALRAAGHDDFVTALYGALSAETGHLELAVAGHPLPVLVDAQGGATMVGRPGTLLGPYEHPACRIAPVLLEPGATLVLYTDGVTDVPPPHGLDDQGTLDLMKGAVADGLSADEVADRIHARLSTRLPIADRTDDIALLVLRMQ